MNDSRRGKFSKQGRRAIRILFLGQCTATGYGVTIPRSYPQLVRQSLAARFPSMRFEVEVRPLLHPRALASLVKSIQKPDLLFMSLPGMYASIPFRVNLLYLHAPGVMMMARSFLSRIESRIRSDSRLSRVFARKSALQPTTVLPALSLDQYEQCVSEAVELCQQPGGCRVILMGPGGFNEYSEDGNLESPELASAVNNMLLRVARLKNVPFINAYELADEYSGDIYLPQTHRWGLKGHEVMAREIEHVLAAELMRSDVAAAQVLS
jgi:hypothetical protein